MIQFNVQNFFKMLDFKILVLQAEMSIQKCSAVAAEFNNLNNDVEILTIIYSTYLLKLNFHYQCSNVVYLKSVINFNIIFQNNVRIY